MEKKKALLLLDVNVLPSHRAAIPSLLVGLIHDHRGNRFTPAHAVKTGKRYRYYVSQATIKNPGSHHPGPTRIPAVEIENLVRSKLQSFLVSPRMALNALASTRPNVSATQDILSAARGWSKKLPSAAAAEIRPFIRNMISRIVIHSEFVDILINKQKLRSVLLGDGRPSTSIRPNSPNSLASLKVKVRLERCGGETRFVPPKSTGVVSAHPVQSLIRAIARARSWYARIIRGGLTSSRSIAIATGLDERYVNRILPCAFLAPDIMERILDGRQPPGITLKDFRIHLPMDWAAQRQLLGFSAK